MDKAIIKLIVAMTIIVVYPSYAVDYEYCSKLMEQRKKNSVITSKINAR